MVLSADGEARVNTAFDQRKCTAEMKVQAKDTAAYTLYFRGGLAVPNRGDSFRLHIRERRLFEKEPELRADPSGVDLSSTEDARINLRSAPALPNIPAGYDFFGMMTGRIKTGEQVQIPLEF